MRRFLATSDWHPDWATAGVDRYQDVEAAARWTVDLAIRLKVDAYAFLGDLSNPETVRSHRAARLMAILVRRLRENGIPWIAIPGNHDVIEDGSGTHTASSLHGVGDGLLDAPGVADVGGILFAALPFVPRSHAYDPEAFVRALAADGVVPDVVIGHLNLEGIAAGSETEDMPRGREIFFPYRLIAELWPNAIMVNGHYHRRQYFRGVHIPGSLERLVLGSEESNTPGVLVFEVPHAA